MSITLQSQIESNIKDILRLSYLPLMAKDLFEILEERIGTPNRNTFNAVLDRLADTGEVKKRKPEGKRDNIFSTMERMKHEGDIILYGIAKKKLFTSQIPPEQAKELRIEEIDTKVYEKKLYQFTGLINYYEIRKICGIHEFSSQRTHEFSAQRPRQIVWVQQLQNYLAHPQASMSTTAIAYFESDDVNFEILEKYEDNIVFSKLIIPYGGFSFDDNKKGIIIDGQQRMWATNFIVIEKGEEELPYLTAPICIILGDFDDSNDDDRKIKIALLRKEFIVANSTKNVTLKWKRSLSSVLDPRFVAGIDEKVSLLGSYEVMTRRLNNDKDSPFIDQIDLNNDERTKKDLPFISKANMIECIKLMVDGSKKNRNRMLKPGIHLKGTIAFEKNLMILKNYFNSIRIVWEPFWKKDYMENRIKSTVVLFSFAFLFNTLVNINSATKDRRDFIKEDIIRGLLIIQNETDFEREDPNIGGLQNNKTVARKLYEKYLDWISENIQTFPLTKINEVLNKIIQQYPEGSL